VWAIWDKQYIGARFALTTPKRLVAATAEFSHSSSGASFFVAVVPLASLTALPAGSTELTNPFNPGVVLFSKVFTRATTGAGIENVPLGIDVPAGVYGIVFGSGIFGASGSGGTPPYFSATGSTGMMRNGPASGPFTWVNLSSNQFNVGLVIGDAAVPPTIGTISAPRQVVALGQNLTLAASVSGATSLQWKRNGRPIPGATTASHTITNAVHQRDRGWYQLTASNAGGAITSPVIFVSVAVNEVVAWGQNSRQQLAVPAGLTAVTEISAGFWHALALRSDGTVVAWGDNEFGQTNVPVGLASVVAVAATNTGSFALSRSDSVEKGRTVWRG
jgi:hypothetical protein